MRLWAKVVVGVLAVMVLFCLIAGMALVQSGVWNKAKDFGGGVFGIAQSAKGIEALDKTFAFQEPPDGAIAEDRLLAFIEIRKATKPAADTYEEWMKAHQGNEAGDFEEAREVIRLTGDVMRAFKKALEAQKMAPREYAWLDRKVRDTLAKSGVGHASDTEQELIETIREVMENPRLTPGEREKLRAKVQEATESRGAEKGPMTPDGELCSKYRVELEATALGEFSGMMVQGFAQSGHAHHRRSPPKPPGPTPQSP
jgi:hypothetical protein